MNLLVLTPTVHDPLSFYRAYGPTNLIEKQYSNIHVKKCEALSWHEFSWADIFFAQRPFTQEHLNCIKYAKRMGIPCWVDYDDNLFHVGQNNKTHALYNNPDTQAIVKACASLADTLSVSTEALVECYGRDDAIVIPNALPDYLLSAMNNPIPAKHNVIWRGSNTHNKDLYAVRKDIIALMNSTPEVMWHFLGYNPWFITMYLEHNNFKFYALREPLDMYDLIVKINPSISLVPLEFNTFNNCKSNIAWIEQTTCGALTIAPNTPEWHRPGILNYNENEFGDRLKQALELDLEARRAMVEMSRIAIKNNLLLSKVNKKRVEILNDLAKIDKHIIQITKELV